jgi:hypothetical protein
MPGLTVPAARARVVSSSMAARIRCTAALSVWRASAAAITANPVV